MTPASFSARTAATKRDETPLFGRLARGFHRYFANRRTRHLLMELDEHMLRDIGLTRGDLDHAPEARLFQRVRNFP